MYTEGIKAYVTSYVLYANRSAAYFQLKDYDNALADANLAIQHKPDWLKVGELNASLVLGSSCMLGLLSKGSGAYGCESAFGCAACCEASG